MTEQGATIAYGVLCVLIVMLWSLGVRARTRRGEIGGIRRAALLVPAGVLALLFGLLYDLPGLIGLACACILIGEYWRGAYRPPRPRRTAQLLAPAHPRWTEFEVPSQPELELLLEDGGALIRNIGGQTLILRGWSPTNTNAWLATRAQHNDSPLAELPAGHAARLAPWPLDNSGVRVWYAHPDEPARTRLFRADWVPVNAQERVLN